MFAHEMTHCFEAIITAATNDFEANVHDSAANAWDLRCAGGFPVIVREEILSIGTHMSKMVYYAAWASAKNRNL